MREKAFRLDFLWEEGKYLLLEHVDQSSMVFFLVKKGARVLIRLLI